MPAAIRQYVNNYDLEDVLFPGLSVALSENTVAGNMLVGFSSWRYGNVTGFLVPISDSQTNTWTALNDTAHNPGINRNSVAWYTTAGQSDADSVNSGIYGLLTSYNTEVNAWELTGVSTVDSASYSFSNGATSAISGSLTTQDGYTFNFSTTRQYQNWYLTLVAFRGIVGSTVSLYVMAFCTVGITAGVGGGVNDTVSGWTFLHTDAQQSGAGGGGYNGIYAQAFTYQLATGFQYPSGAPVANGYLLVNLDRDCQGPGNLQIESGRVTKVPLDNNGMASGYMPFVNSQLTPNDSSYVIRVYSPAGQLVRGPYLAQN